MANEQIKLEHKKKYEAAKKKFDSDQQSQLQIPSEPKPTLPIHDTVGRARFQIASLGPMSNAKDRKRSESAPIGHLRIPSAFKKDVIEEKTKEKKHEADIEEQLELWRTQISREKDEGKSSEIEKKCDASEKAVSVESGSESEISRQSEASGMDLTDVQEFKDKGYEPEKESDDEAEEMNSASPRIPFGDYVGTAERNKAKTKSEPRRRLQSMFNNPLKKPEKDAIKDESEEESLDDLKDAVSGISFSRSHSRSSSGSQ